MADAMATSTTKSLENKTRILYTEAPNTFLIPISLTRSRTIKLDNPSNPRQATIDDRHAGSIRNESDSPPPIAGIGSQE